MLINCILIIYISLFFRSTMQNTESGRKLNQAMLSTGRAVATTGKAVGKINS